GLVNASLIRDLARLVERDEREPRSPPLFQKSTVRHRKNPGGQSRCPGDLELWKHAENLREQLLQLIFRIRWTPPAAPECPQRAGKSAEQILPRSQVPCFRPLYCL